ncbi:MAG: nucleotidyltransferase family protein [Armatimonadia bacterium]
MLALLRRQKGRIERLARRYGARNVLIFGSVARGEDDADSDVDLLVELEPGRSLLDLAGLKLALEQILGRPVDVVTKRGLRDRLRQRVLAEAVAL